MNLQGIQSKLRVNIESVEQVELTIMMPCLNEAETIAACIRKAGEGLQNANVSGEILIADNGSTDQSRQIALEEGARIIDVPIRGYGAAARYGIAAARGKYVLMADADDSYDFREAGKFLEKLREGYQLVMGTRLKGKIEKGAMPFLHQYLGNPVLTFIGNLLFRSGLSDFHCGMRAFERQAMLDLNLSSNGMEFATEMVAKASLAGLSRTEVPVILYPDGRSRSPHLRTWRDGWRHLSFMLLMSPNWLFLLPGGILFIFGLTGMALTLPGLFTIGGIGFDIHSLLISSALIMIGVQVVVFWLTTQLFMGRIDHLRENRVTRFFDQGFPLSFGLITGIVLFIIGLIPVLDSVAMWAQTQFGDLQPGEFMRLLIPGLTFCIVGIQIFFASFVLSLLNFSRNDREQVSDTPGKIGAESIIG